jgi:N-formylglutamate amidohydrolase
MPRSFALRLLVAVTLGAVAADPAPKGDELLTVQKGALPVIISAPHGGRKAIPDVPERVGKGVTNFATVLDGNTAELAERLAALIERDLKAKPWLVAARFTRKHLDVNRPREHAYESEKAKPHYDKYHAALEEACKAVKKQHGRGVLLDIHGQGVHPAAICRGTQNGKTVSLLRDREGWSAVRGKNSVLGRMETLGYKVLPAGAAPLDTKEETGFTGGYIVGTYGSHTAYAIDAIQLEFGSHLRAKEKLEPLAKDLCEAVRAFYDAYLKDGK